MPKKTRRTRGAAQAVTVPSAFPIGELAPIGEFDYSTAELEKINAAVEAVRGTSLAADERASLLMAAVKYHHNRTQRGNGTYLAPRARAELWTNVAELCAQLCQILETIGRNQANDRYPWLSYDWRRDLGLVKLARRYAPRARGEFDGRRRMSRCPGAYRVEHRRGDWIVERARAPGCWRSRSFPLASRQNDQLHRTIGPAGRLLPTRALAVDRCLRR
jgi:hypothetical protein